MAVRMVRSLISIWFWIRRRSLISIWFWICKRKWRFLIPLAVAAYLMVGGATASYIVSREACDLHQDRLDREICEIKTGPKPVVGVIGWPLYWPIHAGYNLID